MANEDFSSSPSKKTEKSEIVSGKTAPVVNYISILLLAAFFLLVMTFLMEQRESAEVLDGIRHSVSAMQTVESLYEENGKILEENNRLEQEVFKLQHEIALYQEEMELLDQKLEDSEVQILALDLFWQVNEAYVLDKITLAKGLIVVMEEMNLDDFLPLENISETERFSPAHRYAEIKKEINFVMPESEE